MGEILSGFIHRSVEYLLFMVIATPLLAFLVSLVSTSFFFELLPKMGMLVGSLVALSGAFSVMGLSNVFFERHGRLGITDDERHDVSLHAAARIVCGIGAFFLFLLLS